MTARRQTSIQVSPRARAALDTVATSWAVSRDEAVRRLLTKYIERQAAVHEELRLTHISTVLRFPPPPLARGGDDGRVRLAFRAESDLLVAARSYGFQLPGQSERRGPAHYSARPLTDAVLSAIAMERPFVDDGLNDLPALVTRREALGLWRLTVAATLTRAEQRALLSRDDDISFILREEGVAWHSPWRSSVALHLARQLLVGSTGERDLLHDQTEAFNTLRYDLELSVDFDHPLLAGLVGSPQDPQGRGGTAVWRAERQVALTDFERWFVGVEGRGTFLMQPPGWELTPPPAWHCLALPYGAPVPAQEQRALDHGRVVALTAGSRRVLWPYDEHRQPVTGFESVVVGAGAMSPIKLVELTLVGPDTLGNYPWVPAGTAHELGFISAQDAEELVAHADIANRAAIEATLRRANGRLDQEELASLRAVRHEPKVFARRAARFRLSCRLQSPGWAWHVESIVELVAQGSTPARLTWLAGTVGKMRNLALERDMERAWHASFWLGSTFPGDV